MLCQLKKYKKAWGAEYRHDSWENGSSCNRGVGLKRTAPIIRGLSDGRLSVFIAVFMARTSRGSPIGVPKLNSRVSDHCAAILAWAGKSLPVPWHSKYPVRLGSKPPAILYAWRITFSCPLKLGCVIPAVAAFPLLIARHVKLAYP